VEGEIVGDFHFDAGRQNTRHTHRAVPAMSRSADGEVGYRGRKLTVDEKPTYALTDGGIIHLLPFAVPTDSRPQG
jgi:hypothetical protein